MIIKDGVTIELLHPQIKKRLSTLEAGFNDIGLPFRITSGHEGFRGDGVHGADSLHYIENTADEYCWAIDVDLDKKDGKPVTPNFFFSKVLPILHDVFPNDYFAYEWRYGKLANPPDPDTFGHEHVHIGVRRGVLLPTFGSLEDLNARPLRPVEWPENQPNSDIPLGEQPVPEMVKPDLSIPWYHRQGAQRAASIVTGAAGVAVAVLVPGGEALATALGGAAGALETNRVKTARASGQRTWFDILIEILRKIFASK